MADRRGGHLQKCTALNFIRCDPSEMCAEWLTRIVALDDGMVIKVMVIRLQRKWGAFVKDERDQRTNKKKKQARV